LPPETLAAAALVTALTYLVFGLTGFGSTVLALPLLVHLLPLKFVVPMLLLLDFAAGAEFEKATVVAVIIVGLVVGAALCARVLGGQVGVRE